MGLGTRLCLCVLDEVRGIPNSAPRSASFTMLPTDVEYRAISNCYSKLCHQLHYPSIGSRLIPAGVITIEAHESIRHSPNGSREQNEKFVNILAKNSSKEGFYKFMSILKGIPTFSDLVEVIESESI